MENKIKAVLFDLDGTLLPMDQDEFTKGYFGLLVRKMAPFGYDPERLIDGIWSGTAAMVKNDCERTNEEAFWRRFAEIFGDGVYEHKSIFEEFYAVDFKGAQRFCGFNPDAAEVVRRSRRIRSFPRSRRRRGSDGRDCRRTILNFTQHMKTPIAASRIRAIFCASRSGSDLRPRNV